ncbi:MAG TPA: N-methyl-L-tryptophan oxidase [Candidatus Elarobacter sp.]|nr:N-methyl-L-tryptophan oxidase [Candidatus Elarobacter sp.]
MTRYDAVVLGLGAMGSAVAAHAAARGMRVLGLERFGPAHARGSSHGSTRIIRQAYFESPQYVPLLRRAYELWDALASRTRTTLRVQTGGLFVGRPETPVVAGTLASAEAWQLAHRVYDAAELRRRYPMLAPRDDEIAVYEAVAGVLFPEAGVRAHLDDAVESGAELRFGARVRDWSAGAAGIRVVCDDGTVIDAARLAICAGPWFARVAPDLGVPLRVERNVQLWFAPRDRDAVSPERLPVYGLVRDGARMLYGFPDFGEGAKAAYHGSGIDADPDALDCDASEAEIAAVAAALAAFVPAAAGPFVRAAPCMYTLTPDEHFVIGAHPGCPNVAVAGGFSGHGYKFAPVVGEVVAAVLAGEAPAFDVSAFDPARFAGAR